LNVGGWRALIVSRAFRVSNPPTVVRAPDGFLPTVPPGFRVNVFASGFRRPRWLTTAPNGDVFVTDSSAEAIIVLHHRSGESTSHARSVFVDGLSLPYGVAIRNEQVYVACSDRVVRYVFDLRTSRRLSDAAARLAGRRLQRALDTGARLRSVGTSVRIGRIEEQRRHRT